jgi:peptidoglycan/LPS O-acetylase OafA/YrhL
MSTATTPRLPAIDAVKAIASQLIVVHHLAYYGPMTDAVYPSAETLVRALRDYALMAVPAFLVVGGFLAARALLPRLADLRPRTLPALLWGRYLRLARPYVVALICAIACAWLARLLAPHPDIPDPATLLQVAAHLLLLQDIVGMDALSAGVWYVAIDFQLYALLLVLAAASRLAPADPARFALAACGVLAILSFFWINRDPELEIWAPYFFGAYGLGILAERLSARPRLAGAMLLLAVPVAAALFVEWRGRVLVAGLTALLLLWSRGGRRAPAWAASRPVAFLSRISYSLFLIHYPVCMLAGALVARLWPGSVAAGALGMLAAWLASIAAAAALQRVAEVPGRVPRTPTYAIGAHQRS